MFGLADLKKINERAAEKAASGVYKAIGGGVYRDRQVLAQAHDLPTAQKIADALNLADAVAEANANAVGRT